MADDQVLADIRGLLYDQSASTAALINAVLALRESLVVPAPEVHVAAPILPEIVIPASTPVDLGPSIAQAMGPAFESLATLVQDLRRTTVELAEKVAAPPPTIMRGGGITAAALTGALNDSTIPVKLDTLIAGGEDLDTRFAYDADGRVSHIGQALHGSGTANSVWSIKKFTYDADGREELIQTFADTDWDTLP